MGKHKNRKVDLASVDYETGYCKPPKDKQIKKGQSLNPSGKSKKQKRKEKTLEDYYAQVVSVPLPDGTVIEMTRREMAYDKASILAAKGDPKALKVLLEYEQRKEAGEVDPDPLIFDEDMRNELIDQLKAETQEDAADAGEANPSKKKDRDDG